MIQNLALSNISPIQEFPEKTEKGKESSRRGRDAVEEEGGGRRGKEDAEPPPQATTAIAWITDKYFGTPLQVSSLVGLVNNTILFQLTDQRLGKLADWVTRNNITVVKLDSTQKVSLRISLLVLA